MRRSLPRALRARVLEGDFVVGRDELRAMAAAGCAMADLRHVLLSPQSCTALREGAFRVEGLTLDDRALSVHVALCADVLVVSPELPKVRR